MTFERPTNALSKETPARFAGGRFSRANEENYVVAPIEKKPSLVEMPTFAETRLEPRAESAAFKQKAGDSREVEFAEAEKTKTEGKKRTLVGRLLNPIKNPWLPWRHPKTPEEQKQMEEDHGELLKQTGISVAIVGAVDVVMFFVSHGTIPPVKFLSAVAMLMSMMYLSSFKKKKKKTGVSESKTFISERFEKNVFGHTWFPWARRKPKTPEEQAKMQEQHKEYVMSMASAAPILFLMGMFFPQMTLARIAWAFGTMAVMFASAPWKEKAPRVFKSDKRENFVFGRALMFRKQQEPKAQEKTIAETKKLALSTLLVSASAWLARLVGVIPMTPWAYFATASPTLGLVIQRLYKILEKPYPATEARAPEKKSGRKEGPGRFLKKTVLNMNAWENVIFGRALMFRKPQTPEVEARVVRENKRTFLLTILTALPAYAAYALGAISLSAVYAIPAAVLVAFVGIPLVLKRIVVPSVKAAFKIFGIDLDAMLEQKRKDAQTQQKQKSAVEPKAAPQEKQAAT